MLLHNVNSSSFSSVYLVETYSFIHGGVGAGLHLLSTSLELLVIKLFYRERRERDTSV